MVHGIRETLAVVSAREPKDPEAELVAQQLEILRNLNNTTTELTATLRGGLVNSVLDVEIASFDVDGQISRGYQVPMGSVAVTNHTGADVIVSSGPPQASAPGAGKGLARISAGKFAVVNVASRDLTLYGPVAGLVSLQVFTKAQPPTAGMASDSDTTPGAFGSDVQTVAAAGTAEQLGGNAALSVTVKALDSNTGLVYLGDATVTDSTGFPLAAGETFSADMNDTSLIWVDADTNGEGVRFFWVAS